MRAAPQARARASLQHLWLRVRGHWVTLLGLVAVVALVIAVDPAKIARALEGADLLLVSLMLPVALLLYLLHGFAWSVALRGARARVGVRQAVRVTYISQAFVFLPGGDLWRVPIVKSEDDEPLDTGVLTATVVFDDLVYLLVLTLFMLPGVLRLPVLGVPLAIALLPQVVIFTILLTPRLYAWLAGMVARWRPVSRFREQIDILGPTFRGLVTPRTLVPVMCLDLACAAFSIALFALGLAAVHATGASLGQVAFTYAGSQVVTGLTVIPGALGVYEGMMTGAMALQGVEAAAAAGGALLYRLFNDVIMALVGLAVAFLYDREYFKELRGQPAVS